MSKFRDEKEEITEFVWILVHEAVDRATGAYYETSCSPSTTSSSPSTSSLSSSPDSPSSSPMKAFPLNHSTLKTDSVSFYKDSASKNVLINPFSRPNRFRMGVNTGAADVITQLRNDLELVTKERDYWRAKCEEVDQTSSKKKRKSYNKVAMNSFTEIEQ